MHTFGRARPKVWRGERPTEPMPLVDSLRRTPYRDPNQLELTGSDDEAGTAIDLAVRVGELLLRCGAGARDVESGVIAVAAASGLDNLEVDITNQSLLVQGRTPAGTLMTMLRVVRSTSRDFARLVAVHRLVEDLAAGRRGPRRGDRPAAPDPPAEAALAAMVRLPGVRRACGLRRHAARRRRHRDPARARVRRARRPGGDRPGRGWGCPPSTSRPSAARSPRCSRGWRSSSGGGGRWVSVPRTSPTSSPAGSWCCCPAGRWPPRSRTPSPASRSPAPGGCSGCC